ncbi:PR14L protein, partial [Atractosteus spatula]|nr:PR14L protein [Atractosteus spatula]
MVSRFRIRRTLPKPPANLTPMGLPRPVRLKKKQFSLEEIYTNKNFRQPPEGRLETIFEVPVSGRDGALSLIGPRRIRRALDFPEAGVARKPRRLLGSCRRAGAARTRRAGRSPLSPSLPELDSLLSAKLDQLEAWIALEESGAPSDP